MTSHCYTSEVYSLYSTNNLAEEFFAKMPVKNGGTYDALILGLVKVRPVERGTAVHSQYGMFGVSLGSL